MWGVSVTFVELQQRPVRRRRLDGEGLEHGAAQMIAVAARRKAHRSRPWAARAVLMK